MGRSLMRTPKALLSLFFALSIVLFVGLHSESRAAQGSIAIENGKRIFETKCSACHTIGGGKRVGPDLKGITEQRSRDWLLKFISDPEKMFQAGDPIATSLLRKFGGIKMPDLGLSQQEIFDVLSYIASQRPPSGKPPQREETPVTIVGSSSRGEKLFTGVVPLQNGGPPCMSCHNVSGIPFPGGGILGPDLTKVYLQFGPTAMNSVLATLPFPTMAPIFDKRPLTLPEQHDLEVFFEQASALPPTSMTAKVILSVIGGFIVLMIVIGLTWHKRLLTVRKSLVDRAMQKGGA